MSLAVVENTDFKLIWLHKRSYYRPLKRSENSKIKEISRKGSNSMHSHLMRFAREFRSIMALVVEEHVDFKVIWLRKQPP